MRRFWFAFTGALCFLCSGSALAANVGDKIVTIYGLENANSTLLVRSCPGLKCPVVARLGKEAVGELISVGCNVDGHKWYHIRWRTGDVGWAAGQYLHITTYVAASGAPSVVAVNPSTPQSATSTGSCTIKFVNPAFQVLKPYWGECLDGLAHRTRLCHYRATMAASRGCIHR